MKAKCGTDEHSAYVGVLLAIVPEDDGQAFYDFYVDHEFVLGRAAGDVGNWRSIGPPEASDEIYRSMRTDEQREFDRADAEDYLGDCQRRGGETHRNREEYWRFIGLLGIEHLPRPLIIVTPTQDFPERAILPIPIELLDTKHSQRALGRFLCLHFTEHELQKFRENGVFTQRSVQRIQIWLDELHSRLRALTNEVRPVSGLASGPVLVLDELKPVSQTDRYRTRLYGKGEFVDVDLRLGTRQLFFVLSFFTSLDERCIDGRSYTVVSVDNLAQELCRWNELGLLEFNGRDRERPTARIVKMWGEFIKEMSKVIGMQGVFVEKPYKRDGEYLYLMALGVPQSQVLIKDLSTLFGRRN